MKLIWTRELDAQNPWEPDFHGVFFYQETGISFYYRISRALFRFTSAKLVVDLLRRRCRRLC
mgnify:CR=1 FL=1